MLPILKTYYKAIVIKTVWYQYKDRYFVAIPHTGNENLRLYDHLLFSRGPKMSGRAVSSTKVLDIHTQKAYTIYKN